MLKITTLEHRFIAGDHAHAPLIVALHGRGDSMAGYEWLPHAFGDGYAYLLVNAPERFMPGMPGHAWYSSGDGREAGILRSRDLLLRTLDEVERQGLPSARTCLLGFSQGCLMAVDVGLRMPRPLGAVLGFSGQVAFPERAAAEKSDFAAEAAWRLSHGTRDEVLPIDVMRPHVEALRQAGIPVTWVEHDGAHEIPDKDLRDAKLWLARHVPQAG